MKAKNIGLALVIMSGASLLSADPIQVNESNSELQLFPKVVEASGGNFLYTWCDNQNTDNHEFEVYSTATTSSISKGSYTDHELSVPSGGRAGHRLHSEMISSGNGAIVAWVDHKEQKVYTSRITDDGSKQSAFGTVEVHPAAFMTPPEMCETPDGGAIFVWVERIYDSGEEKTYNHLRVKRIESDGTEWSHGDKDLIPRTLSSITLPRICADGDGGAMIAWVQWNPDPGNNGYWEIYLRRVNSGGSLEDSILVDQADWSSYNHHDCHQWKGLNIARLEDTTYVAMQYRFLYSGRIIKERNCIRVVRDGQNPSPRLILDSLIYSSGVPCPSCPCTREVYSCLGTPVVAASSNGAYITWSRGSWDYTSEDRSGYDNIFVARIDSDGSLDSDFNPPEQTSSGGYTSNRAPQIICDGNNALVVWQNMTGNGDDSRLYKRKILTSGPTGSATTVSSRRAFSFDLINAGSSNAVVVWSDKSGSNWDIYAKKFQF